VSTIWRALCLDHNPLIAVDLFTDGYEARSWEHAVAALPTARESHPHCDLVLGGFSYPLVTVACVGGPAHCVHRDPRVFDVDDLRLPLAAWLISYPIDDPMHQQLSKAHDRWMSANRCWPRERLGKLAGEMGLTVTPGQE
jgi:hypothetical protein